MASACGMWKPTDAREGHKREDGLSDLRVAYESLNSKGTRKEYYYY